MSYRLYLKSIGRKPIKGEVRTVKKPGDLELVWDSKLGKYVAHKHVGEPTANVVSLPRRKRA